MVFFSGVFMVFFYSSIIIFVLSFIWIVNKLFISDKYIHLLQWAYFLKLGVLFFKVHGT